MSLQLKCLKIPHIYRLRFGSVLVALPGPNNSIYLYSPLDYKNLLARIMSNSERYNLTYSQFKKNNAHGAEEYEIVNDEIHLTDKLFRVLGKSGEIYFKKSEGWLTIKRKNENECSCDIPTCGKCLGGNCKNSQCDIHTQQLKDTWRKFK